MLVMTTVGNNAVNTYTDRYERAAADSRQQTWANPAGGIKQKLLVAYLA